MRITVLASATGSSLHFPTRTVSKCVSDWANRMAVNKTGVERKTLSCDHNQTIAEIIKHRCFCLQMASALPAPDEEDHVQSSAAAAECRTWWGGRHRAIIIIWLPYSLWKEAPFIMKRGLLVPCQFRWAFDACQSVLFCRTDLNNVNETDRHIWWNVRDREGVI